MTHEEAYIAAHKEDFDAFVIQREEELRIEADRQAALAAIESRKQSLRDQINNLQAELDGVENPAQG